MKLYVFGTCAGTEPMPGRHHTAFAVDIGGRLYWFDAGENCSYTAHTMGVDLLSVSDIFLSHTHMDHVGGLGNLLWNIRKLTVVTGNRPRFGDITVHTPNRTSFEGTLTVLKNAEGNYSCPYQTLVEPVADGVVLKNDDVEITAYHTDHLAPINGVWQSFSFQIKAEQKTLVYSGDIRSPDDLAPPLEQGCDLLLVETGHNPPEAICQWLVARGYAVGSLYFLHHGRVILHDYDGTLARCRAILPAFTFGNDGDVLEL